jgi:DNA polymerase-3 subunit psi
MHNRTTLQLMGIQTWELTHPERLPHSAQARFSLPESCQLLLVSPMKPQGDKVAFFEKILKAMKLELSQALHITPDMLSQLDAEPMPGWVWLCGVESAQQRLGQWTEQHAKQLNQSPRTLISPPLAEIEGQDAHKRQLWNQIRAKQ